MADGNPSSALDFFWLQADEDDLDQNPLERELSYRLDVLARYRGMVQDALASGNDSMAEALMAQQDRQSELVARLRAALDRSRPR